MQQKTMKKLFVLAALFLSASTVSAQQFITGGLDKEDTYLSPAQFKKRFSGTAADTIENIRILSGDSVIYQYRILSGKVHIGKNPDASYNLTENYRIPINPDSSYVSIYLMRYNLTVGKKPVIRPDTLYLKEQLKGRLEDPKQLMSNYEELKKKLSKSSNWDEYDVKTVDYTAILGWEMTLALLSGEKQFLPILETYRTDIFLVNSGESSEAFSDCERLLTQLGYRQFATATRKQ